MDKNLIPKISIIIPCYNAENYLEKAVNSIVNQTYKNLEIICIDDGSNDRTKEILLELQQKDDRIIVVSNEQNLKLIQTLNKGIEISTGEYIARMDADDVASPEKFEKQLNYLLKNNLDLCGTFAYLLYDNKLRKKFKTRITLNNNVKLSSLFDSPLIHPTVLGVSNLFKEYGYNDSSNNYLIEDYELWRRIIKLDYRIGILPEYLFEYRVNPNGESQSKKKIQKINHLQFISTEIDSLGYKMKYKSIQAISGVVVERLTLIDLYYSIVDLTKVYSKFIKETKLSNIEYRELRNWYFYKCKYIFYQLIKDKLNFNN